MSEEVKIFNLQGQVEKISTRKGDGSLVILIATQELKPSQAGYLMMLNNKHVHFFLAEKQFHTGDIEAMPPEPKEPEKKYSASQKLRFELFDHFRSMGKKEEELEQLYQNEMSKIISHYRSKRKPK